MHARHIFVNLAIGLPLFVVAGKADAQPAPATDAEYTAMDDRGSAADRS